MGLVSLGMAKEREECVHSEVSVGYSRENRDSSQVQEGAQEERQILHARCQAEGYDL